MKILTLNGVNFNMLGIREPDIYGDKDYGSLDKYIRKCYKDNKVDGDVLQTNREYELVEEIQAAYKNYDGIIINAGAYTHTSVAILDALKAVSIPTVEVHLSDISSREEFRKISYISLYAEKVIAGKGFRGYAEAVKYLAEKYGKK